MSETDCKDFLGIDVCRFCLDKAPEMLSVLSVAEKIYNFLQIEVCKIFHLLFPPFRPYNPRISLPGDIPTADPDLLYVYVQNNRMGSLL